MYQWCGFKSRRGKNKNLTAQKSNSNTVWFNFQTYIDIYIYSLQSFKEDFRQYTWMLNFGISEKSFNFTYLQTRLQAFSFVFLKFIYVFIMKSFWFCIRILIFETITRRSFKLFTNHSSIWNKRNDKRTNQLKNK